MLTLYKSFHEAKLNIDPKDRESRYFDGVRLGGKQAYLFRSNLDFDLNLGNNYKVEIIDFEENLLKDITANVGIQEFVDENGFIQMWYELANLPSFYGYTAFLKFSSTIADFVLYSNPFLCAEYNFQDTLRIDFKNFGDAFWQGTRVAGVLGLMTDETEDKTYLTIDGTTLSEQPIISKAENVELPKCNKLLFEQLISVLKHDLVYIDGVLMTNKPQLSSEDFYGSTTNIFKGSFKAFFDRRQRFDWTYQIYEPFRATSFTPFGVISINYSGGTRIDFNKNIERISPVVVADFYDYETDQFISAVEFRIFVGDNFIEDASLVLLETGKKYYVLFSLGQIQSIDGEPFSITDKNVWTFEIVEAEFDSDDFDEDFLI